MKKQMPAWLVLVVIMLVASFLLAGTNMITKDAISEQAAKNQEKARVKVLPEADSFLQVALSPGAAVDGLFLGQKGNETIGYVGVKTVSGYGGPIELTVGVDKEGVLQGLNVGGSNFSETAGLGAKAKEDAFMEQFVGKKTPVSAIKAGEPSGDNTIDAITAATITSNAVARGVNDTVKYANKFSDESVAADASEENPGSVLLFKADGTIDAMLINEEDSEAAFKQAQKLVGQKAPFEIDTAEDETLKPIMLSANAAYEKLNASASGFSAGTASASAEGFAGPVAVEVTFDESEKITNIKIGDDNFAETQGLGAKALEPEFAEKLVGKKAPLELSDIEAISGATITSQAVVDAINEAHKKLASSGFSAGTANASAEGFAGPVAVEVTFDESEKITNIKIGDDSFAETPGLGAKALEPEFAEKLVGKKAPLELSDIEAISGATITSQAVVDAINEAHKKLSVSGFAGGKAAASAEGFAGPVAVEVTFDESEKITNIKIGDDNFAETQNLGAKALEPEFAEMLVGKKAPLELSNIEAISGATITSQAVVDAINEAHKIVASGAQETAAEPSNEETPETEDAEPAATSEPEKQDEHKEAETSESGIAVKGTGDGFGGEVNVEVVFSADGEIESLKIDEDDFSESEGIGTRVLEEEGFIKSFIGKKAPVKIEDIEAVSGATITSEAVVDAVNDAYKNAGFDTAAEPSAEEPAATQEPEKQEEPKETENSEAVKGTGDGFGGDVNVEVVFSADGEIESLKIDEDDFSESEGIGTRVLEEESFIKSFIGQKAPVKIEDIEAVSGATITSEAVVDAVNDAYKNAGAETEDAEPAATLEPEKQDEPKEAETSEPGKAVKGTGDGFGGEVNVEVVFSADGEIESLKIDEDDFSESEGIGTRVLEEESFIKSFIGKKAPVKIEDIEAVSGATITSQAVVDAVNDAYKNR